MTTIDHNPRELMPPTATRTVQVVWSSTGGLRRDSRVPRLSKVEFVLQIETLSADRGMIEAWIQTAGNRVAVLHPSPVRIVSCTEVHVLHLDAFRLVGTTTERIAAMSLLNDSNEIAAPPGSRVLYAQTSLLAAAGFPAGSYDPPTIKRIA